MTETVKEALNNVVIFTKNVRMLLTLIQIKPDLDFRLLLSVLSLTLAV